MTTVSLPITTYSVRSARPTRKFGSTAVLPVSANARVMGKVSFAAIPAAATITNAVMRSYAHTSASGSQQVDVRGVLTAWGAAITWSAHLTKSVTAVQATDTESGIVLGTLFEHDLTAWAQTRPVHGIRIEKASGLVKLRGSAAASMKPVLVVTYTLAPLAPTNLQPSGSGVVSQQKPDLTFAGDAEMTDLYVEIDTTGDGVADWNSGWVPATIGRFVQPAGAPTPAAGATVRWRARVRNAEGDGPFSGWHAYVYRPLLTAVITNPGATSPDGSPTVTWDVLTGTMARWRAELLHRGEVKASSGGWMIESGASGTWTPSGIGVPVPGEVGEIVLTLADSYTRVGTQTTRRVVHQFTTTDVGAGAGMDTLTATYAEPVVSFEATRASIPDEISLLRDGVQVPIWNAEGEVAMKWPGIDLLDGGVYRAWDYSVPLDGEHTWHMIAWTNGVPSAIASSVSVTLDTRTRTVWLVDPESGEQVEVVGIDGLPSVDQFGEEQAILHVPISNGALVEPVRRRLTRTTLAGTVSGAVHNDDDDVLARWASAESGHRYRLIFGKVNWTVILGNYQPLEPIYQARCSPERTGIAMGWWQRLGAY